MNIENQTQRHLTEEELNAFEWRVRCLLEQGDAPEEVELKLLSAGLTKESARRFVENVMNIEKETKRKGRESFVSQLVGVPLVIIGLLLVAGNTTGLFPTFPFAGFLVIILGILIGAFSGYLASLTIK